MRKHLPPTARLAAAALFHFSLLLFTSATAVAATITWTGGGDDNLWSNGDNWGGTAPGASDTAVFDSTSAKNCTVDEDFAGTVGGVTITDGYAGTITLARTLYIKGEYSQAGGTFTCGDNDFTIGNWGGSGSSQTAEKGKFTFSGGTFNCPSGNLYWRPFRTGNNANFTITGANWNANGGTFVIDIDHAYSYGFNGQTIEADSKTFCKLLFKGSTSAGKIIWNGFNNVVTGKFRVQGVVQLASSQSSWSTTTLKKELIVQDAVEYADGSKGGNLTLLLNTAADQTVSFLHETGELETRGVGMVIDKPDGKKVTLTSDNGKAYLGYGSSDWDCAVNYGVLAFSAMDVQSGELDMSSLDLVQVNSDNYGYFSCASGATIAFPAEFSHQFRLSPGIGTWNGLNFRNLSVRSGANRLNFASGGTNYVSGSLKFTVSGIDGGGADIASFSEWASKGRKAATIMLSGDLYLDKSFGGQANIVFCGESDQTI